MRLWPYAKRAHVLATAALAPARQAINRLRGGYLPHRAARTLEEVLARGEGRMIVARETERLVRRVPHGVPADHRTFVAEREEVVPRVAVAALPGGRVLGPCRAVITERGTLVGELSPYFGIRSPNQNPVFIGPGAAPPTVVPEPVGVLAARGDVSYYHYVVDVLPRLALLEELDDPPEKLYVPASLPHQQQLLELLGISPERIIDADRVRHLQAEKLVVPGLPDPDLKTPPWVVAFLRERLLPSGGGRVAGRRLYVTRGRRRGSRVVTNEDELVGALEPLGFAVVDPGGLPVAEQIRTFAEADWVVAPHGAALTNLAFASRARRWWSCSPPITCRAATGRSRSACQGSPTGTWSASGERRGAGEWTASTATSPSTSRRCCDCSKAYRRATIR